MNLKYPVVLALTLSMLQQSPAQDIHFKKDKSSDQSGKESPINKKVAFNDLQSAYSVNVSSSDSSTILLSLDTLKVTLFEQDSAIENRTISIENTGLNDLTLGLSLVNTSHETVSNPPYLDTPILFKTDVSSIQAVNASNSALINERSILLPYGFDGHDALAFDGEFLYSVRQETDGMIYKFNPGNDNITDSVFIPDFLGLTIEGLAHSGKHLYASNTSNNTINKIDFSTGNIIDQIYVENLGLGLTFGGNRGTLFAQINNNEAVEINVVTKEIINRFAITKSSDGLGYSKELDLLFSDLRVFRCKAIDPNTGEFLYNVRLLGYGVAGDEYFGLKWLDFESIAVQSNAGTSSDLQISFNPADLEAGTYKTTAQFDLNDGSGMKIDLPIVLTIAPLTDPITAQPFCVAPSGEERLWEIYNPNTVVIDASWNISNTGQADSIKLQPGVNTLLTNTGDSPTDSLQVSWLNERGMLQDILLISNDVLCDTRGLTLNVPNCITNPDTPRLWQVFNPNSFSVSVIWSIIGTSDGAPSNTQDSIQAMPGNTTFFANLDITNQTAIITWSDEEGNIKRQKKVATDTPCMGTQSTLARNSLAVDQKIDDKLKAIHVFPNPFNEQLSIPLGTIVGDQSEYQIIVYDMLGNTVYKSTREWQIGQSIAEINTSNFVKGTYILFINSDRLIYHRATIVKN